MRPLASNIEKPLVSVYIVQSTSQKGGVSPRCEANSISSKTEIYNVQTIEDGLFANQQPRGLSKLSRMGAYLCLLLITQPVFLHFSQLLRKFFNSTRMFQIILALILITAFYHLYWKRRRYPPGPIPLPIIGNMLTVMRNEPGYGAYLQWKKDYGPIYTSWLGMIPCVSITDYQLIKETFIKDAESYADKLQFGDLQKIYRGGHYGVLETNGELWKEHRRFATQQLKDMGLGKNIMEQKIICEVEVLNESISKRKNEPISMAELLDAAVGSVINQLLFGYRFDEARLDEFLHVKSLLSEQMQLFGKPSAAFLFLFPWLRHFPYFNKTMDKVLFYSNSFFSFFGKQIEEHEKQIDYYSDEVTDYVDSYLKEKKRRELDGDMDSYNMVQLTNMCLDLWSAGMETTSNTLSWAIVYVLNNPEVQVKIHAELDKEINSPRIIASADKKQLVYVQAVVCEVQRVANLLPQNFARLVSKDVNIGGYKITKGTPVIPQISCVLYDENVFPQPFEFRPERFIDESGKIKKVEELIPFSIGKRQCLGEGLARMELFLFTANLFNKFKFLPDVSLPSLKKKFGITVQPQPYCVRVEERH